MGQGNFNLVVDCKLQSKDTQKSHCLFWIIPFSIWGTI